MDTGKKKSMAAVICIFLIFVTFASLFYVAREENHNCTGKDCPICACVHQAKQVLRNLGTTPAVGFFANPVIFIAETVALPGLWIIFVHFVSSSKGKIKRLNKTFYKAERV